MWPLYAAGFTTAFGAHGIAANLGGFSEDAVTSLLVLGGLLALYDGAEVCSSRSSARSPTGSAPARCCSAGWSPSPPRPRCTRSPTARAGCGPPGSARAPRPPRSPPSASALVARLNPAAKRGRAFGSYGFYKSHRLHPRPAARRGAGVGRRPAAAVRGHGGAGRRRRRVGGARRARRAAAAARPADRARPGPPAGRPAFLTPTAALAAATAALSVGRRLPARVRGGGRAGHRRHRRRRLRPGRHARPSSSHAPAGPGRRAASRTRPGSPPGCCSPRRARGCAMLPGLARRRSWPPALIGAGTGLITPLGFAALAASTPPERLGQTMGAAELGRELGDAGGPLLVAGVADGVDSDVRLRRAGGPPRVRSGGGSGPAAPTSVRRSRGSGAAPTHAVRYAEAVGRREAASRPGHVRQRAQPVGVGVVPVRRTACTRRGCARPSCCRRRRPSAGGSGAGRPPSRGVSW